MKTRRLRLVRPKWTMGTMLLVVGWSAVVVWLNVRPRFESKMALPIGTKELIASKIQYGCPWSYASMYCFGKEPQLPPFRPEYTYHYRVLAGNIAIGLLAVAVLTFASKYLARAIAAAQRAVLGKPPPNAEEGPERAKKSL